jgi:hypothetical protein
LREKLRTLLLREDVEGGLLRSTRVIIGKVKSGLENQKRQEISRKLAL